MNQTLNLVMKIKGACGEDQNKYIVCHPRAQVRLLLSWSENKLKNILQKRIGFPQDFMGGQTPLLLNNDLEHLQKNPKE